MNLDPQLAVILIIFAIIFFEFIYSKIKKLDNYNNHEALSNIAVGGLEKILMILVGIDERNLINWFASIQLYYFALSSSIHPIIEWTIVYLFAEFIYYCIHWYHHHIQLGWATHFMHHSPTKFNFTLSLRFGLTKLFSLGWLIYFPVAFSGLELQKVAMALNVIFLYQFFVHTELWPPIKFLDLIFNTPVSHRVHHSSNAEDYNKNFGGITMIYDHVFGTYKAFNQNSEMLYGMPEIMKKKNFWYEISFQWKFVLKNFINNEGLAQKFKSLFGKVLENQIGPSILSKEDAY